MNDIFCMEMSIPCTSGDIQGRIQYREENQERPGVILCPPHPLLAGNMDNNVITALANRLAKHFTVLTFDYRNVGKSFKAEGDLPLFEYWDRLDQAHDFSVITRDTAEVIGWSERFFKSFHLIGYSFGSFIGHTVLSDAALSLTCITPPLNDHEFNLADIICPTLFIFAEEDDLVGGGKDVLATQAVVHEVKNSDHFFLGKEQKVCDVVEKFLGNV